MGIDIYAAWCGRSGTTNEAVITGFSVQAIQGYLHEGHDDEPYVTRVLVPEAFDRDEWVAIPARLLRARLPGALALAEFGMIHNHRFLPVARSLSDFVALWEAKEQVTGQPVLIRAA